MPSLPVRADHHPSPAFVRAMTGAASWTFTYCFFANHLPFLAPNRSEPCPRR